MDKVDGQTARAMDSVGPGKVPTLEQMKTMTEKIMKDLTPCEL
jgi:hypothetical protein